MYSRYDKENAVREARRARILELVAKGKTQQEIADELKISQPQVSYDYRIIKRMASERIRTYIEETLPAEHQKATSGIESIIAEAWKTAEEADELAVRIQALKLAKECYEVKLSMLTDAQILDKAVKHSDKLKSQIEALKKGKTVIEAEKKEEAAPVV